MQAYKSRQNKVSKSRAVANKVQLKSERKAMNPLSQLGFNLQGPKTFPLRAPQIPTFKSFPSPIQKVTRNVDAMDLPVGLTLEELNKWDRISEFDLGEIHFTNIGTGCLLMESKWDERNGKKIYGIGFNPEEIKKLPIEALFFLICHELSHLHYEHAHGSDSLINEFQADDTAVVTVMTQDPKAGTLIADGGYKLLMEMDKANMETPSTHPLNKIRFARVESLVKRILSSAELEISIESNYVLLETMRGFCINYGQELELEEKDVHIFKGGKTRLQKNAMGMEEYTSEGEAEFAYLKGIGEVNIDHFISLKEKVDQAIVKNILPNIRMNHQWKIAPKDVHASVKDQLPA